MISGPRVERRERRVLGSLMYAKVAMPFGSSESIVSGSRAAVHVMLPSVAVCAPTAVAEDQVGSVPPDVPLVPVTPHWYIITSPGGPCGTVAGWMNCPAE